ncbi:Alpha/Beta hydrolase fold [Vigna unguiculata]|uniref:Alpha/Beta hydrolase fold n=1 Tax=Vigna unguiculata TaxID=3917 RepID=A0A4D6MRB6_VIGUN|nr:Alpha/Beta hydrolase fold [Vigna unguiculata]
MMRQLLSGINTFNILDRYCKADSAKKHEGPWIRSLTQNFESSLNSHLTELDTRCQTYRNFLVTQWANDGSVRKSLHIREPTYSRLSELILAWVRLSFAQNKSASSRQRVPPSLRPSLAILLRREGLAWARCTPAQNNNHPCLRELFNQTHNLIRFIA